MWQLVLQCKQGGAYQLVTVQDLDVQEWARIGYDVVDYKVVE